MQQKTAVIKKWSHEVCSLKIKVKVYEIRACESVRCVLPCASHRRPAGVQSVDMAPPPAEPCSGFLSLPDHFYIHMTCTGTHTHTHSKKRRKKTNAVKQIQLVMHVHRTFLHTHTHTPRRGEQAHVTIILQMSH